MANDRYKQLSKASVFIAGDEEQFQSRRDYTNLSVNYDQRLVNELVSFSNKFSNLSGEDLTNTFRYIFHKFKKGIYIRIKDNKLTHFLPFSKIKYVNEWGDRIKYNPTIFRKVCEDLGYRFNERNINNLPNTWYGNNCLVRYEYPICENDTDLENYHDLFTSMCENSTVPDIEFFINRRDFPILKNNNTEPYNHIWDSEEQELVSHSYKKYFPIFSSSSIPSKFSDILFPTAEDWARVRKSDGVSFSKYENVPALFYNDFDNKLNTAVFRGSSTGIGVTIDTNQRLKVASLMISVHNSLHNNPLLNAGITKWKNRPRKLQGSNELKTIDIKSLPFDLVKSLTPTEQSRYKYIIHIKGYVSAYRLSYELNMGSVILMVDDPDGYRMWFSHLLEPYIHYVPVKSDLSDLFEKIIWCRSNNEKMKEIIKNCKQFYNEHLTKTGVYRYITSTLHSLKKHTGTYTYNPFYKKQLENERSEILRKINSLSIKYNSKYSINNYRNIQSPKDNLTFIKTLEKTKTTIVDIYSDNYVEFVVKNSANKDEMTHEQFIGLFCVNKLLKTIPNFLHTFGEIEQGLVIEKIGGINFRTWLDTKFDYPQYIHILSQLNLALIVAQRKCLFVHYDLFPWNVMIQTLDEEIEIQYPIDIGKIVVVKTKIVPIIIDYGKTSAIVRNNDGKFIIHSTIKPFEFDKDHDMRTIVISSIKHLVNNRNGRLDMIQVIKPYYPDVVTYTDMRRVCNEFSFSNSLSNSLTNPEIPQYDFISKYKIQDSITNNKDIKHNKRLYRFSDEVLSTYYSLFNDGAVKSSKVKVLCRFNHTQFTKLTDEMLHNRDLYMNMNEYSDENIDYYDMLETIINYNKGYKDYFKKEYSYLLKCDRLVLMNYISTRNTYNYLI